MRNSTPHEDAGSTGDGSLDPKYGKPDAIALKSEAATTVAAPVRGAVDSLAARLQSERAPAVDRPERKSFEAFLREDAMVPVGNGRHGKYSFEGREALLAVVRDIDAVLGSNDGQPLEDSVIALAGGAQFGKTILELNLGAYAASQSFLNFGLYLPDDKLADVVIDTKFRPDVVDQIPWLARMTQVGKAVNSSGKQVNTKKACTMTDGNRRANFLVSGLQKPATTITLDVACRDEEDDIPPRNAKFVKGRLTSSNLRIQFIIGTQRVHGRGMQRAWEQGSQGVFLLGTESEARQFEPGQDVAAIPAGFLNPEEEFPGIVRHALSGRPRRDDPKLTWSGDFRRDGDPSATVSVHKPTNTYYLADPQTGEPINRLRPVRLHRNPGQIEMRRISTRISQLAIGAIGLSQLVNQFQLAVEDPEEMTVFRCDVLGLPKSTAQAITPDVIQRAQTIAPFEVRLVREPQRAAYAGLDMGDKCWLTIREVESPACKRIIYAASITSADVVRRIQSLSAQNLWDCLLVDQRPLVAESRDIAIALNGLLALEQWPAVPLVTNKEAWISLPGGLTWNGNSARWQGLKAAVVRFDRKKLGMGLSQEFDQFESEGVKKFVPLVNCNREETIDRVVRELLTPDEGVNEVLSGQVRVMPAMLLPSGELPIIKTLERQLIAGSEREREEDGTLGDYKDGIENHFTLANGYSALAEICGLGGVGQALPLPIPAVRRSEVADLRRDREAVVA